MSLLQLLLSIAAVAVIGQGRSHVGSCAKFEARSGQPSLDAPIHVCGAGGRAKRSVHPDSHPHHPDRHGGAFHHSPRRHQPHVDHRISRAHMLSHLAKHAHPRVRAHVQRIIAEAKARGHLDHLPEDHPLRHIDQEHQSLAKHRPADLKDWEEPDKEEKLDDAIAEAEFGEQQAEMDSEHERRKEVAGERVAAWETLQPATHHSQSHPAKAQPVNHRHRSTQHLKSSRPTQHHLPPPKAQKAVAEAPPSEGYPCTCGEGTIDCREQHLKTTFVSPQPRLAQMKVERLYLQHNRLTGIFKHFILGDAHRSYLKHLDLSYNDICYVQRDGFEGLDSLSELLMSYNRLESLSDDAFSFLPELRELRLDHNRLTNLTGSPFQDLEQLRYLVLSNNPIRHMDAETFRGLSNLEELDLENTELTYIGEEWFFDLSRLQTLKLNRNQFLVVPTLHNLASLSVLDLSHNPIEELTGHSFEGLTRLRELSLAHMPRMHSVDKCGFCGVRRLQTLKMFNNSQLLFIDAEAFGDPSLYTSLQTVDLENDNLAYLSEDMLNWPNVTSLKLGGNPWHCDCRLSWLTDIRLRFQVSGDWARLKGTPPRCFHPRALHGHLVDSMHETQMCQGGAFGRGDGGISVGKVFVGLTVLLLVVATVSLGWFCWVNKGGRVVGNPTLPAGIGGRRKKKQQKYQYRNLAMAEELDEGAPEEDDLYTKTNAKVPPAVEL